MIMTTNTEKLIEALQLLSESIDSVDGIANALIFEAAQRLNELQTALQSAHASLGLARNERDEARAEVEERKDALLDASRQIDELKKQRDIWLHKARQENEKLLNVRVELEGICNVISDAGFSDVVDLLNRVKRLIEERDEAILKMERLKTPQPDRLQIAAIILAGSYSNCSDYNDLAKIGLKQADALIAAAKEAK
jgi:uncharacterized coiled-coil DUF342 family protein